MEQIASAYFNNIFILKIGKKITWRGTIVFSQIYQVGFHVALKTDHVLSTYSTI